MNRLAQKATLLTTTAGKDLASQLGPFKTTTFEYHSRPVTVGALSNVMERLHITFEVEEELKRWKRQLVLRLLPLCVGQSLDADGRLNCAWLDV